MTSCEFHRQIPCQFQNTFQECINVMFPAWLRGRYVDLVGTCLELGKQAEWVCFCKRRSCNPVLSKVSSGPPKGSSCSVQVQISLYYKRLLLCLQDSATQLLESICSSISPFLRTVRYKVRGKWSICYDLQRQASVWSVRPCFPFAPAHAFSYLQMLLIVFPFFLIILNVAVL